MVPTVPVMRRCIQNGVSNSSTALHRNGVGSSSNTLHTEMNRQFRYCVAYKRVSVVPLLALTQKGIGIFQHCATLPDKPIFPLWHCIHECIGSASCEHKGMDNSNIALH